MATNMIYKDGDQLPYNVGAGVLSGAPVVIGAIPGVTLDNADALGVATVRTKGVFNLSVTAVDAQGNAAVTIGAILYMSALGVISLTNTGIRYGYAYGAIDAGDTANIPVKIGY